MTQQTDISRLLERWLVDDEPDVLPERVLGAVAGRLPQVRQRGQFVALGLSGRFAVIVASLTLAAGASLVVFGIVRPGPVMPPGSPTPTAQATGSASPTPSPVATPYVSTQFGFQATKPLDNADPWTNFLYAPVATGTAITFPDGRFLGGDLWSAFIVVSSGTHRVGAVVGVSFPPAPRDETPAPNPDWAHASLVRIWNSDVDELAADYVAAVGGTISGERELDGERAILIYDANEMAEVVVAVHGNRAFVIGTSSFMRSTAAPGWERFLASFSFLH
ncbi:MAG TPA: hypothetical protein VF153_08870 [Candidatus Limnocylindria bacterium]